MAKKYSAAYGNTQAEFEMRIYAHLTAQSIAIAAALALAAKKDVLSEEALEALQIKIRALDAIKPTLPIDRRDRNYAYECLIEIFKEAKELLKIEFPHEK